MPLSSCSALTAPLAARSSPAGRATRSRRWSSTTSRSGSRPNAPSPASTAGLLAPGHGTAMPQQNYEIRVRGRLGGTFRTAFPGLCARTQGDDTVLSGSLADRAALYGVLAMIETLGLELVELRQLNSPK